MFWAPLPECFNAFISGTNTGSRCPKRRHYLVVQVEVVELAIGAEVLRVPVQRVVDVTSVALDDHRVPVVVVQEAAARHRRVTEDGAVLVAAYGEPHPTFP